MDRHKWAPVRWPLASSSSSHTESARSLRHSTARAAASMPGGERTGEMELRTGRVGTAIRVWSEASKTESSDLWTETSAPRWRRWSPVLWWLKFRTSTMLRSISLPSGDFLWDPLGHCSSMLLSEVNPRVASCSDSFFYNFFFLLVYQRAVAEGALRDPQERRALSLLIRLSSLHISSFHI